MGGVDVDDAALSTQHPAPAATARPRVVKLAQLVLRDGVEVLTRMAARGEVSTRMFWVAAQGAREMVRAVAAGDVTTARVEAHRRGRCMACSGRRDVEGLEIGSCGELFRPSKEVGREGCGCLCDGLVMVGSAECVRGRWEE